MKNWKFKGMQSFKFFEIFLFFLFGGICGTLFCLLSQLLVDNFIPIWSMWSKSMWYNITVISLFAVFIGLPIAKKLSKKKIDFWSVSIQDSNLYIFFKQKEWNISIVDIHSINFIEVHYGEDNKRILHINFKGEKLKICLPENGFMSDISAADFEAIDDFFSYIRKSKFFANEKVNSKVLSSEKIIKETCLTK